MKTRILGLQKINFTNKDGEAILGNNIFVAFVDENVDGVRTEKFFLKDGIVIPKEIKPNDDILLSFNHKGRVEMISKA